MKIRIAIFSILLSIATPTIGQPTVGAALMEEYLPQLEGKRVAVCGNHTSMIGNTHLVDTLAALKVSLVAIFSPEHGFRGNAEAGASIKSGVDERTGLPIISLYGKNKKPTKEQFADIDVILFDIQDVGCRFYTYISTMHYVMEAAAENNVKVIVLDRPNPNGYFVDGPVLNPKYKSFVGMHKVPVVHGMTIGEYALMINGERWLANSLRCNLQVVRMKGYDHTMRYHLPVAPSPNLQSDEAIYLYPSLCLFEGTCISVGRGTDKPFQIFGHPDLAAGDHYFTPQPIKGVSENPPHNGKKCRGFDLSSTAQARIADSNYFSLEYVITAYQNFPDKESFFLNNNFFCKLAGTDELQKQIVAGMSEAEIRATWQPALEQFKSKRKQYLLYPDFE